MSICLAIHGGAGLIRRDSLSAERQAACRRALAHALDAGWEVLADGGSAVDGVVAAARSLEDDPVFNAGRGAVLARGGGVELDAALMDGSTRRAGAITGATTPRSPIVGARAVMEQSSHVLLAGSGADAFLAEVGVPAAELDYFRTPERIAQYDQVAGSDAYGLDHGSKDPDVYGTIGAVACDAHGHVAAATSTGGMVNKRPGRVGDSPLIGAGTWAWDRTAAISGTGHGEPFIRLGVAHRISAWMELGGLSLQEACDRVVHIDLVELGGEGGVIAVDAHGNIALPFNTAGMFRAWRRQGEAPSIAIW